MTSFDTLQSISSRLLELTNQLSTSKLSKEELAEFETLSRKIYERAVILNYKSKEESVYGKSSDKMLNPVLSFNNQEPEIDNSQETPPVAENDIEAIIEEHDSFEEQGKEDAVNIQIEAETQEVDNLEESNEAESHAENEDHQKAQKEEKEKEKETPMEAGRVQFDFSGGFETPAVEEKSAQKVEVAEEEKETVESENNEELETVIHPQDEEAKESEKNQDKAEEVSESVNREEESIAKKEEPMVEENSNTSLNEILQEGIDKTASFYARFSKANKEARGDRLGTSKISSLKGAIGLNDRLQFINELFGGNSNLYNDAIEELDQLESNEASLRKLSEIAAQHNWNKEDSSVDEFGHFITRRYVD